VNSSATGGISALNFLTLLETFPANMSKIIKERDDLDKIIAEKKERLKELSCINQTTDILKEGKSIEETLQRVTLILPPAWQYPEATVARVQFDGKTYISPSFIETEYRQAQVFETLNNKKGIIEIFYTEKFKEIDEGPFMKEERHLINNLATMLANYINSFEAREILSESMRETREKPELSEFQDPSINSRQLLQKFLNKQNANRDIFHDLMPFKVKEILLIATLYDAFTIEKEGRFSEHILGEYHQLNLTSMPRVTGVSSYEEALVQMRNKHYDLVIMMMGSDRAAPVNMSKKIKEDFPYIPIYLLVNNNRDIAMLMESRQILTTVDRTFVWNGDSKVFFAMVKHLEDKVNVENDTKIGTVKVILLIEDSEIYYSKYLPLLYNSVMEQTKRLIEDVGTDDLFKVLRLRARPKILLASNYEEAIDVFDKYKESLLCLIADVKFEKGGILDNQAGFQLVKHIKAIIPGLPTIIQSSDTGNARKAFELKSTFINKNSESLLQDIKSFISHHLGFGNFVYRDASGKKIAIANTLSEFQKLIETIPAESLIYHGKRNHFSLWLMARGEIKIAKMINPVKVSDFESPSEFREYLKYMVKKYRNESYTGKIVNFEESVLLDESNIVSLGTGALGGKGRGLAFINTLVYNLNFTELLPLINIRTPKTSIIGTDEFDIFLERNNLTEVVYGRSGMDYASIRKLFLRSDLSYNLEKKLKAMLKVIDHPIAIRSSSLFEDSTMQPFSGVYETYLLPNNHPDFRVRLRQAFNAIKLVYASIFSPRSTGYLQAINYKIEEEKMAIVIQEVVGKQYDDYYYPHISGTAQSHNYYPVSHMEPDDGFSVIALGLGQYVVSGEKSYRFSPRYPEIETISPRDLYKGSQLDFYAINMNRKSINLLEKGEDAALTKLEISKAEEHQTLTHLASVYDPENDRIEPGLSAAGPRIVNFANILKYEYVPLAKTIELMLDVFKEAMGSPVELEFAVDLTKGINNLPSFYLLQMKPLIGNSDDYNLNLNEVKEENIIVKSKRSMGNGKVDNITDIVFVKPEKFDKTKTLAIAEEIESVNNKIGQENGKYILIGPGRWGTRDRFIGIPVNWTQISHARVIVETSLKDFPLDASLGSHFFHNVTSMNMGYFSVQHHSDFDIIDWKTLNRQDRIFETSYIKQVRFKNPVTVAMDGKERIAVVYTK